MSWDPTSLEQKGVAFSPPLRLQSNFERTIKYFAAAPYNLFAVLILQCSPDCDIKEADLPMATFPQPAAYFYSMEERRSRGKNLQRRRGVGCCCWRRRREFLEGNEENCWRRGRAINDRASGKKGSNWIKSGECSFSSLPVQHFRERVFANVETTVSIILLSDVSTLCNRLLCRDFPAFSFSSSLCTWTILNPYEMCAGCHTYRWIAHSLYFLDSETSKSKSSIQKHNGLKREILIFLK